MSDASKTTPAAPPPVRRTQRPNVFGWKGVAAVLGVDPCTARRWADRGLPVFVWGRRQIVAYREELLAWALKPRG
jgi:hypothetical protein